MAVTCESGEPGVVATFRSGEAPPDQLSIAANLGAAVASGTVLAASGSYDTCTGAWEMTGESSFSVSLDLVADGRAGR